MKKTFLEWSVADKKAQQQKWAKEMLSIHRNSRVEWVSSRNLYQNGVYITFPKDARYTSLGAIYYPPT